MAAQPEVVGDLAVVDLVQRLDVVLRTLSRAGPVARNPASWVRASLQRLIDEGLDLLPRPASGGTLQRWRALARVAAHDLALVKLYESHTDALAILEEVEPRRAVARRRSYAVWASEGGSEPLTLKESGGGSFVDGRKSWCSGADVVLTGLLTAVDGQGRKVLVELATSTEGVSIDRGRWHAVGMHDSGSYDVICRSAVVRQVGPAGAYLDRPGFWQGGIGVAACWYGAAAAIGARVRDLQVGREDVHALAHLGAIDAALTAGRAVLRECAEAIEREPSRSMAREALRVRGLIADIAETVVHHAGRALGPGPLCNEADLARRVADLPIFIRQSRAEHDRVAQARMLLADADEMKTPGWTL